jgi:hypothetical protein
MRSRYKRGGLAAFDGGGAVEGGDDESTAVYQPDDETEQPSGSVTASGGLPALDIPGAKEAFALMANSSEQARKALQQARTQIMARQYNKAQLWLAASAALGAPTRSGSTAESFGAMANALRGPLAERDALEREKQEKVLGIDTQLAGLDDRQAQAQLALAQLRAKLAADAAKEPNDRVVLADGTVEYRKHADARQPGTKAWTPPPANIPTGFTVVQQPQPDGTTVPKILNTKTGELKDAGPAYVPPRLSANGRQQALGKMQTVKVLKQQLADIREAWTPIKNSYSAGYLQGWVPSPKGKAFDKAVAAARGTIRQLTRVPGEGSMSDWEGKIDQAKLPDRGEYENVTEQSMDQLEKLIKAYEDSTNEMLGPGAGGGGGATKVFKYDKNGKRIE